MAAKKKADIPKAVKSSEEIVRYRGAQLLKLVKYNNRVARVVLKPNELYSFAEADKLVFDFMKKKG